VLIRVFPRKTNATPDDDNVRFGLPGLFDECDEVHISVTWKEDRAKAERLAHEWKMITSNIKIGGPAYDDPGGEFEPGLYVKRGYVMTSRGCPNHCWFCMVPKREGGIRELEIKDGYNILDSNLLACSDEHIKSVFSMLARQTERPRFTGGLEAARFKPWIAEELKKLKPTTVYFAYDEQSDYEPLVEACRILRDCDILRGHVYRCFVLCGYKEDTIENAEHRLQQTLELGLMPMAMLYDKETHRKKNDGWLAFQRQWCLPQVVGLALNRMTS
jgi:hypothetical protein